MGCSLCPQEVDAVHAVFVERMCHIFDLHKAAYGWQDKKLVVR